MHYCTQSVWEFSLGLNVVSSIFRLLISFQEAPWQCLVCYVISISTTTRALFATCCRSTVIIATVSYHYCSYLYYCGIHLRRYIFWYFPLIYNYSGIFIICYLKLQQNITFLKNINSVSFVVFLNTTMYQHTKKSTSFDSWSSMTLVSVIEIRRPLKYRALSGVGWLWWGIYWLRYQLHGFR